MKLNRLKKLKELDDDEAVAGIDGTLINVDTNAEIFTPNKNEYFLGFILIALGLAFAVYGAYRYLTSNPFLGRQEAYIFFGIGSLIFIGGLICVLKAVTYLFGLKKFLQNAKYTKCNIKCVIEIEKGTRTAPGRIFHTLRVDYIDDDRQHQTKIIKYLLARNIYEKMRSFFVFEGDYLSLNNYCVVAYNSKGKIILPYVWRINGQTFGNTFATKNFKY